MASAPAIVRGLSDEMLFAGYLDNPKVNDAVNQDLWKRFLYKKGYNGIYKKCGIKIGVIHFEWGIFETIIN